MRRDTFEFLCFLFSPPLSNLFPSSFTSFLSSFTSSPSSSYTSFSSPISFFTSFLLPPPFLSTLSAPPTPYLSRLYFYSPFVPWFWVVTFVMYRLFSFSPKRPFLSLPRAKYGCLARCDSGPLSFARERKKEREKRKVRKHARSTCRPFHVYNEKYEKYRLNRWDSSLRYSR